MSAKELAVYRLPQARCIKVSAKGAGALEQLRVGLGELLGRKVSGRLMRVIS